MASGKQADLIEGEKYVLTTRIGQQRLNRQHCMTYMSRNKQGQLLFDARPEFGTQTLNDADIIEARKVRSKKAEHYMNRVLH
jgi:hypothetical protein